MCAKGDTMQANKYVLDCNVYISYIINGKLESLAEYILHNEIQVLFCKELATEIMDVLQRPHIKKYLHDTANSYLKIINAITLPVKITKKYTGSPDPKDDYLFAICISHKAILVTGDKILQRFDKSPISVITTTAFKQLL